MGVKYVALGADDAVVAIARNADEDDEDAVEGSGTDGPDSDVKGDGS